MNLPIDIQIELFNIRPIILYACETGGFGNLDIFEKVELQFLKLMLNLKKSTPSFMVYGEVGAYPITLEIHVRIISFWTKLEKGLLENKLSSQLYLVICSLHEQGKYKFKWLENIKQLLDKNGFGNFWQLSNEINVKWLVLSFKQKLKDQFLQNWNSLVEKASSGTNHRIF